MPIKNLFLRKFCPKNRGNYILFKTIDIPNGSRVKEIDIYYWDEDVTSEGSLNQMRHLIHQETNANPMLTDKINNTYSMYLTIYAYVASSSLRFYGVRLKYEPDFFPFPD